jgi:hypothetical protein
VFPSFINQFSETNFPSEAEGNNVAVPNGASPGYNIGMGWASGAQNDIFQ